MFRPRSTPTVPSVARVYDAILGGKDNFAVDRAVADEAIRTMADGGNGARLNRAALGRAVRYMADRGVSQFLDLGSGLPAAQNTHQIAQAVNPEARVVYVDNDPSVWLHGQALLTGDDSTVVVLADVRSPDELLALPAVAGFLDFSRPIGLILNAVIHHLLDEEDPRGIVARYLAELAPGSFMQLTHFCDESAEARANSAVLTRSLGRGQVRSRPEIVSFFDGLDLVAPGVVFLPYWRPDVPVGGPAARGQHADAGRGGAQALTGCLPGGDGRGDGELREQVVHPGGALGDLVPHRVDADQPLPAEVGGGVRHQRPRVGDVGDPGLHVVQPEPGLGHRPLVERVRPAGAGDRAGRRSATSAAADAIAALNARRASEYWTLARIAWPQPIADEAKMSAGAPAGATRATRKAGAQREPRPANASTASGRGCAGPLAGWMACTATQSQVGVSEASTAGLANR